MNRQVAENAMIKTEVANMVRYANMRDELIDALKTLSDIEYQQRAWVDHVFPPNVEYDCFDIAVHILEDVGFFGTTEPALGVIVENIKELVAVERVAYAIKYLLNCRGTELSDAEYITDPMWPIIVVRAKNALKILSQSN